MSNTYGLGGTEVKTDAAEAIQEIGQNKTLLVQKLTQDQPIKPKVVSGLTNVESVFEHYKPEVEVEFEDADGVETKETLRFNNLGDFGKKGITNQSKFINDLDTEKDQYLKIVKQLKSNKILKSALADPDAKQALIRSIQSLIAELQQG
ncbi:hypothetical protein ACFSTE_20790 [Aquimarina hainanensis]|uniref:Type VI secretion system, VipA, VC_A0107 or Hcp2 n=1 Tax=Aquimarina hainanensis TaxID=1578017 RepID=A0ABW5NCL0_9FLAO|nr:hypothetical protein [Aquimarina sp. TRL1]QKX07185.1 hypothetical protein HN014_20455 [Aquimarina sp. TRL1]